MKDLLQSNQIIQLKPVEELQSTAYNLDKAKFYGIKPDEDKTFKKNSAEFYTGSGNPARIPPKDILTKRRSTVANTGHAIMKSPSHGSLPRVEEKAYNPITGEFVDGSADMANKSYLRGRNNMNANINRAQALKGVKSKDNSSQPSYGSGLMKKKEIFGINSSTLNLGVRASNDFSHGIATRSLTLAPSTFKKPNEAFNRSIKFQRESDRYADASNEKAFGVINDQGYHRKTDLSKLTYNSISGKYYTFA
ncbi:unnamed protein product [Moneuplotes crassus]|uniref:Uncharacterized protein n=1 Tax=Euplotes crassus TaxID=5936 RepID=A0AAD1UIH3_EUPCR|nr:unnamed protein product [Moneuplotes crassus]